MSTPVTTKPPDTADNLKPQRSLASRILTRPEFGAIAAAVVIFIFFFSVAAPFRTLPSFGTVLYASSTIGIVAVGVALLMIGGEFDLSAGVSVVTCAVTEAVSCYLVVRTGIPSFLITLATFFSLRGINLAVTKGITGTVASDNISELDGFASAKAIFASDIPLGFMNIKITVVWWLVFTALASWILLRTRTGNWIFAVGGNAASARAVGVPVPKVKIGLFMGVGFLCWFYGMHLLFNSATVQTGLGVGNEFRYIIAAVVGGCLLTGGYGSAIGAAIGAFIFGMTEQGIVYAGFNPDWFFTFLGVMLLLAVGVNLYIRNYASTRR
jgi:simple sugar transport system permease protein